MPTKKPKPKQRQARVRLYKVVAGQMIGREVIVWATSDAGARSAARAVAGPLYEVDGVSWITPKP